jgi:hypothetical protein
MLGYLRPIGNERGSIIVTSNIAFEHWPGAFVGDAIVIPTLLIVSEAAYHSLAKRGIPTLRHCLRQNSCRREVPQSTLIANMGEM